MSFTTHWLVGHARDMGLARFLPHDLTILLTYPIILNGLALVMGRGALWLLFRIGRHLRGSGPGSREPAPPPR